MHLKKVAQLLSKSMHFATELAEFYISYNGGVLSRYTLLSFTWSINTVGISLSNFSVSILTTLQCFFPKSLIPTLKEELTPYTCRNFGPAITNMKYDMLVILLTF